MESAFTTESSEEGQERRGEDHRGKQGKGKADCNNGEVTTRAYDGVPGSLGPNPTLLSAAR